MGFAKTEREWAERAARHLKAELKRADWLPAELDLPPTMNLAELADVAVGADERGYELVQLRTDQMRVQARDLRFQLRGALLRVGQSERIAVDERPDHR